MAIWLKIHRRYVLVGLIIAILPVVYFDYTDVSWKPLNPHEHLVQNGLAYLLLVLFSFFNHVLFVPHWFLRRQYARYAIVVVSCVMGVAYLPHRIEQWFFFKAPQQPTLMAWVDQLFLEEMMLGRPPAPGLRSDPTFKPRTGNLLDPPTGPGLSGKLAIFFLLGSVSTLLSVSVQMANRLRQIETDQLRAELGLLRAQIQPHFLFNTLNSIYSLSIRQDERTPGTIVKLAEFMRYIIRDAHREYVPLGSEIKYITNYIDLQKTRLQNAVQVDYQLAGEGSRWQIAPFLLFSFVENAFKYGVNPEEDSPIVIHLAIQEDQLRLFVANNKVVVNLLEKSTGIGLQNTQDRLRLLYPAAHQLTIDDTLTHFRITLLITLS